LLVIWCCPAVSSDTMRGKVHPSLVPQMISDAKKASLKYNAMVLVALCTYRDDSSIYYYTWSIVPSHMTQRVAIEGLAAAVRERCPCRSGENIRVIVVKNGEEKTTVSSSGGYPSSGRDSSGGVDPLMEILGKQQSLETCWKRCDEFYNRRSDPHDKANHDQKLECIRKCNEEYGFRK
jgi:hypothetical protein